MQTAWWEGTNTELSPQLTMRVKHLIIR